MQYADTLKQNFSNITECYGWLLNSKSIIIGEKV